VRAGPALGSDARAKFTQYEAIVAASSRSGSESNWSIWNTNSSSVPWQAPNEPGTALLLLPLPNTPQNEKGPGSTDGACAKSYWKSLGAPARSSARAARRVGQDWP